MVLATAFRLLVVVLGHQRGHRLEQFAGKGGAIGGGGEPHLAVHRERGELLLGPLGPGEQVADITDELRGQRQQPAGGQPVRCPGRVGGHRRQRRRRDHVGGRRGPEQPFGDVPLAALLHQLHQPVPLQRAQMVVDLLPRQPDDGGEHGGRRGLGQPGQQPSPGRLEGRLGGRRIGDHSHIDHATSIASDKFFCQDYFSFRLTTRAGAGPGRVVRLYGNRARVEARAHDRSGAAPSPVRRLQGVDVPAMTLKRRGCGIHVVRSGTGGIGVTRVRFCDLGAGSRDG